MRLSPSHAFASGPAPGAMAPRPPGALSLAEAGPGKDQTLFSPGRGRWRHSDATSWVPLVILQRNMLRGVIMV
jgi:hypothetical protein